MRKYLSLLLVVSTIMSCTPVTDKMYNESTFEKDLKELLYCMDQSEIDLIKAHIPGLKKRYGDTINYFTYDAILKHGKQLKEKKRVENFHYFTSESHNLYQRGYLTKAIHYLDSAVKYMGNEDVDQLIAKRGLYNFKRKNYNEAITDYTAIIKTGNAKELKQYYYDRALCYIKLKDIGNAVNDLRQATQYGNTNSEKLHDKINPRKRKLSHYVIRCCDGTVSHSKSRRGTCSHHGGVCNWNEPVYVYYREYE